MKSMRYLVCGASLVASLVGVASSSAATWDPQGVQVTATSTNSRLTDANGVSVSCTQADARLTATGDLAVASPAPTFGGTCTGPTGAATVTTFGTWEFTAVSTTQVNASATPATAGGPIAQIHLAGGCTISINGAQTISGNTWNNSTHQLTINSGSTFPLTPNALCFGLVTSPGRLHGTFQLPTSVVIT